MSASLPADGRSRKSIETAADVVHDLTALENRIASALTAAKRGELPLAKVYCDQGQPYLDAAREALKDV